MRLLLKIMLFPITLCLTVIILACRFICDFSGAILAGLSFMIFIIAVLALVMLRQPQSALSAGILAFVISPYGVPALADWLLDRLDDLNYVLKSI